MAISRNPCLANKTPATNGIADGNFTLTIYKSDPIGNPMPASAFFMLDYEPITTYWDFSYPEDYFAKEANNDTVVKVASKIWRHVALQEQGDYKAILSYNNKSAETVANWKVREYSEAKKAKNVILFIGDGMTTNMITAARLLGHKAINGKYQTKMALDEFPILGHQMTHSLDSFITDSANSASAMYTGKKTSVNAMGVYASSKAVNDGSDPQIETVAEILSRIWEGAAIGIVTTASLDDATPAAMFGHNRNRTKHHDLIDQMLHGSDKPEQKRPWTNHSTPDVMFGGGAQYWVKSEMNGQHDYIEELRDLGYGFANDKHSLLKLGNNQKALGLFAKKSLPTWLDRNVLTDNLRHQNFNHPTDSGRNAEDAPGLKEMTLKAIEILQQRGGMSGFFLMAEAASIDKQMHKLDYDRALGDLLELDDTVRQTIKRLDQLGELEDTLIVVTADHGHGFDVYGSVDTEFMRSKRDDERGRREAVGIYQESGESQYQVSVPGVSYNTGQHFPLNWSPRYALAAGTGAFPDKTENFELHQSPRFVDKYGGYGKNNYANPEDGKGGIRQNGTLPVGQPHGVHSLTDVPIFAMGPCQQDFQGTRDSTEIFFGIAECLGLGRRWGRKGNLNGTFEHVNRGKVFREAEMRDRENGKWDGSVFRNEATGKEMGSWQEVGAAAGTAVAVALGVFGMLV